MEALGVRGGIAPTHSYPRHYMGWVVSVTLRPRFTPGERTPGTHCTGGWVDSRAGLDAEVRRKILCLCRGSNPGRSVPCQALSWLSYRGSLDATLVLRNLPTGNNRNHITAQNITSLYRDSNEWIPYMLHPIREIAHIMNRPNNWPILLSISRTGRFFVNFLPSSWTGHYKFTHHMHKNIKRPTT
jgi:hypothetical protein